MTYYWKGARLSFETLDRSKKREGILEMRGCFAWRQGWQQAFSPGDSPFIHGGQDEGKDRR